MTQKKLKDNIRWSGKKRLNEHEKKMTVRGWRDHVIQYLFSCYCLRAKVSLCEVKVPLIWCPFNPNCVWVIFRDYGATEIDWMSWYDMIWKMLPLKTCRDDDEKEGKWQKKRWY